jgi:hypothetical protein
MRLATASRGRPAFTPTDEQRRLVEALVACGVQQEVICTFITGAAGKPITVPTLTKYFRAELSQGLEKANALVAQSLFKSAIAGNNTAQIFWLKTRAGWREKPQQLEHSGPGGAPIPLDLENADSDTLRALLAALEGRGGSGAAEPG